MTEEELREEIIQCIFYDSPRVMKEILADQILTLIKEAGWKSPEEVREASPETMQPPIKYPFDREHCEHEWPEPHNYLPVIGQEIRCKKCGIPKKETE